MKKRADASPVLPELSAEGMPAHVQCAKTASRFERNSGLHCKYLYPFEIISHKEAMGCLVDKFYDAFSLVLTFSGTARMELVLYAISFEIVGENRWSWAASFTIMDLLF